ncbi:MAG: hypothetical protein KC621_34420, partial [Myxococcales bacterium]|nr:hypothetical protein [Myxococcales bacterium]
RYLAGALLVLPGATLLGGTWPVLARAAGGGLATRLYAANTAGAVVGVLACTFALLPSMGVRATELLAAVGGFGVALGALAMPDPVSEGHPDELAAPSLSAGLGMAAAALAGLCATGLEVWWTRLAAVALGATVQTLGIVFAVFLATIAAGAAVGRRWPRRPMAGVGWGLGLLGAFALAGGLLWGQIPYALAAAWRWGGVTGLDLAQPVLAALVMGGAPAASGLCFSCLVRASGTALPARSGRLIGANALGSLVGAWLAGLWLVPALEARGALLVLALGAAIGGALVLRSPWPALPALLLAPLLPAWDARLFAVGVHLRISDFADPSARAVRAFVDEGWELLSYDQGATAAVAVGRSTRTGNTWLSINGKVDASTGDDMPTQVLSGEIPVRIAPDPRRVLVVGLASGVTAGAVLERPGVEELVVLEIEPAVVAAEPWFRAVNGSPTLDPRTTLVVDDARAWLTRSGRTFDVVVSEPSNPWISGVSSLFTIEYWTLLRDHLAPDGVVCQWIQLYGMGTDELRGLMRTFREVYPDAVLFETIEGADILLIGGSGGRLPDDLPLRPLLDARALGVVAGDGWLHTDDHPVVEWRAPRWLHRDTSSDNTALLHGTW